MFRLIKLLGWKDLGYFAVALVFIVLGVWLDLSIPRYLGEITDLVTRERVYPEAAATVGDVWAAGLKMLGFAVGSMLTAFVVAWAGALFSSSLSAKMRKAIYERVGDYSAAEIKKFSVASLITRSTSDVTQVRTFLAFGIQTLIRVPIIAVWAILRMTDVSWELSLVTAVAVASIGLVAFMIILLCLPKFKKVQELTDKLNLESRENLTGIRVVRAYNAQKFEQEKFGKTNDNLAKTNLFMNRVMGLAWPFIGLVFSLLAVAIYWVGSYMIDSNRVDDAPRFFADVMVFSQYSFQIVGAFVMMIFVLTMMPGAIVSSRRINEVLKTEPTITDCFATGSGLNDTDGTIKFNNVNYKYPGAEKNVLSDINIEIKRGTTAAFIGSTGCGKSTLVNLLPRIADPTNGSVTIGGIDIHDITLNELNDFVGYVPQQATLFSGTIKENIAFGLVDGKQVSDEQIEKALKTAQAWDFVSKLDDGINSKVEQRGKNFSGGQKQRLSIARIIARDPKVYIFDDTFSALDYKTDRVLRDALKKATKDATVLIVAQRIGTIRNADQIFVMDKGKIVSSGKHDDLLKKCQVYKQIAMSQLSEEELGTKGGKK